jgi:hypothetical protein
MRFSLGAAAAVAALVCPTVAYADEAGPPGAAPDTGLAVLVGGAAIFLGFAVGGTLIATSVDQGTPSDASNAKTQAGWYAVESGFALAPLASHAIVGEWGRGAIFASIPTATTLATIPVFVEKPGAVQHGSLEEQRVMWGFFCGGLVAAVVGVVDSTFAPDRTLRIAPMLGRNDAGIVVGGAL